MKGIRMKKRLKHIVEADKNCETGIEDVAWLCSLSESEIVNLFAFHSLDLSHFMIIFFVLDYLGWLH